MSIQGVLPQLGWSAVLKDGHHTPAVPVLLCSLLPFCVGKGWSTDWLWPTGCSEAKVRELLLGDP